MDKQEEAKDMTQRKQTTIRQGAVSDVMARLSELPDRGKDPGASVSLGRIFRAKECFNEIKGALKKGYTFDDLAAIFTERCDVDISARQMKYHYTREKNRRAKNNTGGKPKRSDTSNGGALPENPTRKDSGGEAGAYVCDVGIAANISAIRAIRAPKPGAFVTSNGVTCSDEALTFPFEERHQGN
jgi:hypothetical protein